MPRTRTVAALVFLAALLVPGWARVESTPAVRWAEAPQARFFVLQLRPGQDLLAELDRFAQQRGLEGAFIASCAGSVRRIALRHADQPDASVRDGHFEIVSLSGTLAADHRHLHASLSDSTGAVFGGHLMPGSIVYTTTEVVLGELPDLEFVSGPDSTLCVVDPAPDAR